MISVYRKISGVETEICTLSAKQSEHKTAIRGLNEIQISITVDVMLPILEGDYIKLNGVNYTINRDVEYTIESDVKYSYDFVFEHPFYILLNKLYCNRITGHTSFTLTGKLRDFVELLVWCVNISPENPDGVDTGWTVGEIFNTEYKTLTFQDMYCNEVLNKLSDEFQVEYFFNNKQVNFVERIERLTDHVFEHGAGKGLYKLTQQNVDKEDTVTRLLVRGGNQNVPNGYADEEGYLKLPENYLEDFSEHAKVVERKKKFEEEFPRFVGSIATITGENNKILTCPQIDFDIAAIAVGDNARINFLTGDLMGVSMKFNWQNSNKQITLIEQEDETALAGADGTKPTIPNTSKKAKVGDEFNFTGVLMPESYVTASITRLRNKGNKYLGLFSKKRVKFTLDIDHRYMRGKPELIVGDLVVISIPQRNFNQVIRIAELGKNLHTGAISATVSNYLEENWEKYVESKVENVRNDILAKQANVRNTLETIFRDGIVTESELKSIEAILTNLSVERGQLNAQYLVVRGNVNLINKTPLETAWSNYQTAFVDVETAINNAITDKLISDAEKANIYNKISVYSTRLNELSAALENARDSIENYKNQGVLDVVDQNKQYLQDQIDGVVDNWFYPYSPTLANYPASDWTDNTIKDRHIGDTFTNTAQAPATDAGKSWRFVKNGTVYSWTQIADSDAVLALQKAAQAQSTADGKSTTFLVQPSNYSVGDMWVLNADLTVNGTAYKQGEILTATQDSATYNQAHWIKRVRYTDDSAVNNLEIGGRNYFRTGVKPSQPSGIVTTALPEVYGFKIVRTGGTDYTSRLTNVITSNGNWAVSFYITANVDATIVIDVCDGNSTVFNLIKDQKRRIELTSYNDRYSTVYNFVDFGIVTHGEYVIEYFKTEKGTKTTDWTPAPEDVQADIDSAKQEAENSAKAYADAKSEAERVLAEAYADGKVSAEEQARIDDVNAKLAAAKAHAEAQDELLKTQQEAYADGKASAAELAAIAAAEAYANLKKTEAEAYADGIVSDEEARAIADALAKFNASKAHAEQLVKDIEIGGRNLLLNSNFKTDSYNGWSSIYGTQQITQDGYIKTYDSVASAARIEKSFTLSEIGTFTFSVKVKTSVAINWESWVGLSIKDIKVKLIEDDFEIHSITFANTNAGSKIIRGYQNNAPIGTTTLIEWEKLEKGNKATDWSPAPEDVQADIDAEKNRINNILSDNVADPSEKQYLSNLWQEIYAEYPRIWAQANTYSVDKSNYEAKYTALNNLLSPVLANLTTNSTVSGASIRTAFSQYYDARTALQNSITNKVNATASDAQAKANALDYLKQAIGQDAIMNGALFTLVTLLLKESMNADVTAGVSGIQGAQKNLPAFWAGGTYADAIAGTAGIIFRHNSTGKIGVLDVDANGNVKLLDSIDPSIVRLLFSKSAIPSIESIRSGSDSGSVQNASVLRNTTLTSILPETATITNNGVHMSISGSLRISAGLAAGSNYGEAYVGLSLYKNDVFYSIVSQYDMILESASLTTETTPFNVSLVVPAGTYSLVLETSFLNASSGSQAGTNTVTTMTWVFEESIRRFEWGTNGFMNYRPSGHIHHTEEKGLDVRGATNTPGVLLSGSVASGGGFVNSWGAKKHDTLTAQKTATGTYTVYHSAGHTGYSVQITPETDQRVYYVPTANKGTSSFIVYFRNLAGTLSDSNFSFSIMGDNYIT